MAVSFNISGAGFKGANVPAAEAGLVGFYGSDGIPYRPDPAAVRALLPPRWRAAYDRGAEMWWWPTEKPGFAYLNVYSAKGRHLTTIYAHGGEA